MNQQSRFDRALVCVAVLAGAVAGACTGTLHGDGTGSTATMAGSTAGGTGGTAGSGPIAGGSPTVVTAADCKAQGVDDAGVGRWRRLTISQYRNTVQDLLGQQVSGEAFLQDSKTGAFATNADVPPQSDDIDAYQSSAEQVAELAVANLSALLNGCDPATSGEDACAEAFISDFAARAYRRALSESQRAAMKTVYDVGKAESFSKGIQLVIEAALQAPEFVYLTEFGADGPGPLHELDDYELASRLSYLFLDSMPDTELMSKARAGALKNPTELAAQAQRLMQNERYLEAAASFHEQLFRVERLSKTGVVTKGPEVEARFDEGLRSAMVAEADAFVQHLFTQAGGTVKELLTSKVAFPQGPLLEVYGLAAPSPGPTPIADGTRSGFLTLPAVMASVPPLPTRHQAVMRGNLVRRELLCDLVPPPNVAVNFMLPPNADQLSNQELLRVHKDNPACSGCHELMDPIGFGFEGYDGLGQFTTTTPQGDAVDSTGYVQGLDGAKVDFVGAAELSEHLAASPQVRACLATQWFRFALARDPHPGDECSLAAVGNVLTTGDGDIRQALLSLVQSPAFRIRKAQ